ncbi:dihydropteroate synthase [Alteromonas sp. a30]|uniref:dihydropteroate synthase n=1 Tax=Alteromonas sp. a30 TaxID=2730917 RepID=UPI0022802D21|nr:dihydropteroate synthase [Alteromonas sp. a30]MCY7295790.1 dihydropteroate synthase [Alteromonas sp. a30]
MRFRDKTLSLDSPQVMGILNVTPDSFSDGGRFNTLDTALKQASKMIEDGATILDIGGESTRPGSLAVPLQEELDRVMPIIEALASRFDVVLSVDTKKAQVMRAAISAGVHLVNDIFALQAEGALETVADSNVAVCLMHMRGQPSSMQNAPSYEHVVEEVKQFLGARIQACTDVGISQERIIIDPGFGFGKSLQHNCDLLAHFSEFSDFGLPVLAGVSRKSMFGALLDLNIDQRLVPSVVSAVLATQRGASILRVHDVKETVDALALMRACSLD